MLFILVPGAYHGAWCWAKVSPLLEAAGHRVDALDLPEVGASHPDLSKMSLEYWSRFVADRVRRSTEPAILVGHSRGGLLISQAAERVAGQLRGLVYVSAVLLENGMSINDQRADAAAVLRGKTARIRDLGDGTKLLDADDLARFFYHRSLPADRQLAQAMIEPEPIAIYDDRLSVTPERFGSVRRAYIECSDDRIFDISQQRVAQTRWPCELVQTLDSDHSPFFSTPVDLARCLTGIARTWA